MDVIREHKYKLAASVRVLAHSIENAEKNHRFGGTPLAHLGLEPRSFHALMREGFKTIEDLEAKTSFDLLKMENIGRKSLMDIEDKLAQRGKTLADRVNSQTKADTNGNS
jgi:DNA-directed RNA polymerase alpha subunit